MSLRLYPADKIRVRWWSHAVPLYPEFNLELGFL